MTPTDQFKNEVLSKLNGLEKQAASRGITASNYLRNSAMKVLSGTRTGKQYKKPNTNATYTASAAGEAPASRSGNFRQSWGTHIKSDKVGNGYQITSGIHSGMMSGGHLLGELLENGTSKMAPRPYKEAVTKGAESKITALYSKPYYL